MPTPVRVRPLSISIIGWVMIACSLFSLMLVLVHFPLSLFGMMLVGWSATVGILAFGLIYLLIGVGLLRLKPQARVAAIVFFLLLALNGLVIAFIPDTHARMLAAMKNTAFAQRAELQSTDASPFVLRLLLIPMVVAIPLWFVVRRKEAFID